MFTPKNLRYSFLTLYCSSRCKQHEESQKTRYQYKCANCGADIYRCRKQNTCNVFCNQKCLSEYKHKQHTINKTCEICGASFECPKSSTKRFCSPQCQIKWQQINAPRGVEHHSYRRDVSLEERTLKCSWCGKVYVVQPYKINISKFCSVKCKHSAMIDTARHKKSWSERVDTAPQRLVNQLLQELHIDYRNEYPCGCFSIDNYCVESKLFIEVMGTYWHADIRKYDTISEIQKRDIIQDKKKATYVLNHTGKHILYLWEEDLKNNLELCKQLIDLYIQNQGILKNYNSFNYHLENQKIQINSSFLEGYLEKNNDYHSLLNNKASND